MLAPHHWKGILARLDQAQLPTHWVETGLLKCGNGTWNCPAANYDLSTSTHC